MSRIPEQSENGGERSNAALAGTIETELSKVDAVLTGSAMGRIIQKGGGLAPPFWSLGVQGRDRNAPAVLLGDQKGAFSHVREGPLLLQTSRNASMR